MDWGWISGVLILIFVIAQFVAGLEQIGSPLFWVGRTSLILYWKHNNRWPIELKYIGESPKATYHNGFLEIELKPMIKVKEKHPKSKVDSVKIRLVSNNHIYDVNECTWGNSEQYYTLTDKKVSELAEAQGKYSLLFKEPLVDDYFQKWCKGNTSTTVYGIILLQAGGFNCESNRFSVEGEVIEEGEYRVLA